MLANRAKNIGIFFFSVLL